MICDGLNELFKSTIAASIMRFDRLWHALVSRRENVTSLLRRGISTVIYNLSCHRRRLGEVREIARANQRECRIATTENERCWIKLVMQKKRCQDDSQVTCNVVMAVSKWHQSCPSSSPLVLRCLALQE